MRTAAPTPPTVTTQLTGRDVFEILAREHADMLASYLRSLVASSDLVDDLFQETMLIAWRRLDSYDRERPFAPWLRGIAAKLVWKQRERSARDLLNCEPAVIEAIDRRFDSLAADRDDFGEVRDKLWSCLRRLPAKLRETIELTYRQGLFLRQVAQRLGATEEAVKKRVQRARGLLAECLGSTETTS